jgi:acyl dehydratase
MAVNPDYAGRQYPPTEPHSVSADNITAFADAVGSQNVLHTDPEAAHDMGYAGLVAPPTYAVVVAQQCEAQYVADPEAGIDFSRVVHGEQRFAHHSPIVAGDELVGTLHVDAVRQVGGNSMVTTRTELARVSGEPVSTVTSMLVVRGEQV